MLNSIENVAIDKKIIEIWGGIYKYSTITKEVSRKNNYKVSSHMIMGRMVVHEETLICTE